MVIERVAIIKKILSTFLIIFILLGAGSIYANVDSAANLSNWYNKSFQKESEKIGSTTGTGIWEAINQFNFFKSDSTERIEEERDAQVREANARIEKAASEMKNELNQTVIEIKKKDHNLYGENRDIEEQLEQEIETILAEVLGK